MRPWLLFGVGVLAAALGLGWMSAELVRLDARALSSESSRLALWRMDLSLARLIAQERNRPAKDYASLDMPLPDGVLVHFDLAPSGRAHTPQPAQHSTLLALRPRLQRALQPVALANAEERSRNAGEFNRRNFLTNGEAASGTEMAMAPGWYGDALVLARRVRLDDGLHLQGAQLDWERLRPRLLAEVKDLLPDAQLLPVTGSQGDALMLASLPVRLAPGAPAHLEDPERTPLWWVLATAWGALGLVAAALGLLLAGTLALNQRRAAFTSAVTHELRTPITTFKLYAEMLEAGMVPPEKQQAYLKTLREEANRLGELVENVLAHAQLERRKQDRPLEVLRVSELLTRVVPRLAARAGERLTVAPVPEGAVRADRVSVEQILFNLVDNACNYAPGTAITLGFSVRGDTFLMQVADEGPGVSPVVERKLFEPLRKSAAEAADGAQGIGLGLALSRGLARAMGGELRYRRGAGAAFELSLVRVTNP